MPRNPSTIPASPSDDEILHLVVYEPVCGYDTSIHFDVAGHWLGCPPDEATAVARWGRA